MLDKTQLTKVAVAGFGAAMASVYAIPEAHATIVPVGFRFGSVGYQPGAASGTSQRVYPAGKTYAYNTVATFRQFNNANQGKLIWAFSGTSNLDTHFAVFSPGASLSPATFAGAFTIKNPASANGTAYIGFKNTAGNVGWFQVDWGGPGGAVKYLRGAYADAEGESIVVGQMPASGNGVPEPSELGLFALGLLALGAVGVRMRREARKAAELN